MRLSGEIKIGDFGLAANVPRTRLGVNDLHTEEVGTPMYMAPEQMNCGLYDNKVDIFSLGLIFFELYNDFETDMERLITFQSLRTGNFPDAFTQKFPSEVFSKKLTKPFRFQLFSFN